jgi:hypothetical protein
MSAKVRFFTEIIFGYTFILAKKYPQWLLVIADIGCVVI